MRKNYALKRGQAVLEFAVLGSLAVLAFATLLTYGQRFEIQHRLKMEAFRKALAKAYDLNSSASCTLKEDARFLNLFSRYGEGQPSNIGASSSVMWVKGAPGEPESEGQNSFAFYQLNDKEIELKTYKKTIKDNTGNRRSIEAPASIWKEDIKRKTVYSVNSKKEEDTANITNSQSADLKETITVKLHSRFDKSETDARNDPEDNVPQYVYEDEDYEFEGEDETIEGYDPVKVGAYYDKDTNRIKYKTGKVGTTIHNERTWQTAH